MKTLLRVLAVSLPLAAASVMAQGVPAPLPTGKLVPTGGAKGDPMIPYYGNTLACRSDKLVCHIWFNKDGSYRQFVGTLTTNGSLSLSGIEGQFTVLERNGVVETCLNARGIGGPMGFRAVECYPLAGHKVGDEWAATLNSVTMRLSLHGGQQLNADTSFLY